jgi:transposase
MFNLNASMRYWLYPFPTDMRKGFYTLSGLVTEGMGQDVRSGDVFIFLNRHCTSMKALHMEHGGLVIYYMKLFISPQKYTSISIQKYTILI